MNFRFASLAVAASLVAGCATAPAPVSITDTVARTPELSTMNRLLAEAGLADVLRGAGPYTVFAPTDDAFKAVPAKTLADLAADKARLKEVLSFHVVPGRLAAGDVANGTRKSLAGPDLQLSRAGTFVTVEDAMVQQPDLAATNGVVHVIDRVMLPPRR